MSLSRSELTSLVKSAGFTGGDVDIAVAVALAESGGNPSAHNSTPPDDSYGLFQINMLGSLGPDRRKRFNLTSNSDLYDPSTNARVAYSIWRSQGWSPWTTYTRGTYKKHMTDTGESVPQTLPAKTAETPETGGLFGIGAAINAFNETFVKGFASFGAVIVAVVLLVLGVVILLRNQVTSVIPGGKLAKVAKVAKGVSK